jgi:hypothetical protein
MVVKEADVGILKARDANGDVTHISFASQPGQLGQHIRMIESASPTELFLFVLKDWNAACDNLLSDAAAMAQIQVSWTPTQKHRLQTPAPPPHKGRQRSQDLEVERKTQELSHCVLDSIEMQASHGTTFRSLPDSTCHWRLHICSAVRQCGLAVMIWTITCRDCPPFFS